MRDELPLIAEKVHFRPSDGPELWSAAFDSYDGTVDTPPQGKLIGYGNSRYEALIDLLDQVES